MGPRSASGGRPPATPSRASISFTGTANSMVRVPVAQTTASHASSAPLSLDPTVIDAKPRVAQVLGDFQGIPDHRDSEAVAMLELRNGNLG